MTLICRIQNSEIIERKFKIGISKTKLLKMSLVCVSDYEKKSAELLRKDIWEYFRGGSGDEITLGLNCTAFDK